ncbi:nitroreductase family protein [Caldanaerobius polysaccharolyticus]|uniref:nitroreductase family protein n=1 Tax=Caldanaerobius polysaccharolyticus TaxID=44256 RepID=UPI00047C150D|nr:nitroreductase family protein [Caldanaerobius polysaccharolyticus]
MELFDVIEKRRSVRKYVNKPVPEESIRKVLNAARLAPSWANKQCWRFIVVTDPELRLKLGEAMNNNPNKSCYVDAPVDIVVCAKRHDSGIHDGKEYFMFDLGLAMENLVLAAADEGLGTCIIGWFEAGPIKQLLHIPENYEVVVVTPLGYPAEVPNTRLRKELDDIASYNGFN